LKLKDININIKLNNGSQTPLIVATKGCLNISNIISSLDRTSMIECARLLLSRSEIDVNAVDSNGESALIHATKVKSIDHVNLLLEKEGILINKNLNIFQHEFLYIILRY
jgi:ankyrin repeat protein